MTVVFYPSTEMVTDMLTKALTSIKFFKKFVMAMELIK